MKRTISLIRKDNRRALKALERAGVTFVPPEKSLQSVLTSTAEATWTRWVGKLNSTKELELVLRHRDDYRAEHPVAEGAIDEIAK